MLPRFAILAAVALATCAPAQAEQRLSLPQAMQACIALGADKDAVVAYAAAHDLQPWSEADRQAFLERAYQDAGAPRVDGVRFRLEIPDVAGWNIGGGLSLYFLHSVGIPDVTEPVVNTAGRTVTYRRSESLRCEVGGFGGASYRESFYEAVAAVPYPSQMYAFRRSIGLSFVDDAGQPRYFLSVSGPELESLIRTAVPGERPEFQLIRTRPAYGPQSPNRSGAQERTLGKDQLDAILEQGSSFGFWVERPIP